MYLLTDPIGIFGNRTLDDILPVEILEVCQISEKQGHLEKARKIRAKVGQVFRYGVATGRCKRDPTSDLRGALETPQVKHHAALTFVRPAELRKALWSEIDLKQREWRYGWSGV